MLFTSAPRRGPGRGLRAPGLRGWCTLGKAAAGAADVAEEVAAEHRGQLADQQRDEPFCQSSYA